MKILKFQPCHIHVIHKLKTPAKGKRLILPVTMKLNSCCSGSR